MNLDNDSSSRNEIPEDDQIEEWNLRNEQRKNRDEREPEEEEGRRSIDSISSDGRNGSPLPEHHPPKKNHDPNDPNATDLELRRTASSVGPQWSVFTLSQRRAIIFMVAMAGFFSPLSANIYFPALNILADEFNTTESVMNLTLTSYMIFQGLGPTIFGDLAEMAGRRPAYLIGFAIYIGACVGIAVCDSFAALLVLRCLQATGCAGTIALASGVVADISTSAERGTWMGWATSGPMTASAIAPVLGGIFTQFLGWRWIFWFLIILTAAFLIPFVLAFPETGRNVVGNGSVPPQGWNMSVLNYLQARKASRAPEALQRTPSRDETRAEQARLAAQRPLRIPNPLNALRLIIQKDVGMLLFYNSLVYCAFYDVLASAPYLLEEIYGYNALQVGLCFLPFGAGALMAPTVSGKLMDWQFRRTAARIGYTIHKGKANDLRHFPLERARISFIVPAVALGDAALLGYGWMMHAETHLAAPLVMMFIIGLTLTGAFNATSVMLVDLYPQAPATAQSANNLVRCLMGAGATGVIIYMIDAMGRGGCFTFIAGVVVAASPILWVLAKWGPQWREERRAKMEAEKERKEQEMQEKEAEGS